MADQTDGGPYLGDEANIDIRSQFRHALPALSKTCFIQPKSTGLASLFLQFGLLIVSAITAMFFFYHVGGYEYMQWNENSTILEPIHHPQPNQRNENLGSEIEIPNSYYTSTISTTTTHSLTMTEEANDTLVSTISRNLDFINDSMIVISKRDAIENNDSREDTFTTFIDSLLGNDMYPDNQTFGIEQVPMTTIEIGGIKFDWLEVIRISTLVFLAVCVLWFLTMVLFIFTIRCEILDTVSLNITILILVVIYQLVHSLLITALLVFQREMSWRTMAITIGSIVILSCSAFLGCVCFALNCGWVKYIDYMHSSQRCMLLGIVVRLIKGKARRDTDTAYGMAERPVTNDAQRYDNNVAIQNFSAF